MEVAVGRLIREPDEPDSAEVTARGRRRAGVHYLTAMVQTANVRSLAGLAGLGRVRSRRVAEPGVHDVEVALDPPEPSTVAQTAPN